MTKIRFNIDWTESGGIRGPELAATCAEFRMQVGDAVITRVEEAEHGAVRDMVRVSLYPLAEWLATHWWFLTSEMLNPEKDGDAEFLRRHALRTNGEGYAYPDLEIVTSGASTRLVWKRGIPTWTKVMFLEDGQAHIERAEFQEQISALIDCVVDRLESEGITDTLLQEEWAAIRQADDEEARFCEVSAGLGWDPYDLTDDQIGFILQIDENSGDDIEELATEFGVSSLVIEQQIKNHGIAHVWERTA